jgi:SAM-dependent methyltransferase
MPAVSALSTVPAGEPRRRSLFPEFITAGSAAAAEALRRQADRVDKRVQIQAAVEAVEDAAARRWGGRPTDAQTRRLCALAERYVERAALARTLRALAHLHDGFDVPGPLLSIASPRHVSTLLAPDPVAAERDAPLGSALRWTRSTGTPRVVAVRLMADLLARLDLRPGPLPLCVARHLGAPAEPQTADQPPAPVEAAPDTSAPSACFETWTEAVDALSRPTFDDGETGLVPRFASVPWRDGFRLGLSPERAVAIVTGWIVGCAVHGPRPCAWEPPPFEPPPSEPPPVPTEPAAAPGEQGRGEAHPVERTPDPAHADRLTAQADRLAATIHKQRNLHDGQTLTPRRARIRAAGQREADRLEPTLTALRGLALAARAGTTPDALAGFTTRAAVEHLVPAYEGDVPTYPELDNDLGHRAIRARLRRAGIRDADDFAAALHALAALARPDDDRPTRDREAAQIRTHIEDARLRGIPDYFFSPQAVTDALLNAAGLPDDPGPAFRVLDPSAGDGAILDALQARAPRATAQAVEINQRLREILDAKGYPLVGRDALAFHDADGFDRILMNPPFGRGGSLAMPHVRHAFSLVRPGGRLVAVVPESCFFRADRAHAAFRDWLYSLGGSDLSLPHDAFAPAGTSIQARLVVLDRPAEGTET